MDSDTSQLCSELQLQWKKSEKYCSIIETRVRNLVLVQVLYRNYAKIVPALNFIFYTCKNGAVGDGL